MKQIQTIVLGGLIPFLVGVNELRSQDARPLAQEAYLKGAYTGANDQLGSSVAASGDTAVVGAPYESNNATGVNGKNNPFTAISSGAAYVFVRNGTNWSQQAYLKASNTTNTTGYTWFGYSVAISGDTIVVGSPHEASNATGVNGKQDDKSAPVSGAAYVFVRTGTNWIQQAYLKASNTRPGDEFGISVSVSGDTVAVGAYSEASNATGVNGHQSDTNAPAAGAAYVFVRNGTNWNQQAYLKASNTQASDQFGTSVTVSGDTVVVGAKYEASNATGVNGNQSDNSADSSGAAYVFVRRDTNWSQQAYLKASNAATRFGWSAAMWDDTLVVGAIGAAYVFARRGTNWSQEADFQGVDTADWFGRSVAVWGDTVAVGAFGEASTATGINGNQSDNSATDSGAAYVFVRDGSNWIQKAYLKASNTGAYDIFGYSVAVSRGTIVVGAPHEESRATGINGDQTDNGAAFTGAAYIFGPPTLLIAQSNENLRVSWPLWAADFVLEETPTLMATPIPWTQVSLPYQATDADISITVAMPTGNKFYRLRQR